MFTDSEITYVINAFIRNLNISAFHGVCLLIRKFSLWPMLWLILGICHLDHVVAFQWIAWLHPKGVYYLLVNKTRNVYWWKWMNNYRLNSSYQRWANNFQNVNSPEVTILNTMTIPVLCLLLKSFPSSKRKLHNSIRYVSTRR